MVNELCYNMNTKYGEKAMFIGISIRPFKDLRSNYGQISA